MAGLTHRAVAARAGVPVGSTTYYFATLNDLTAAALEQVSDHWAEDLAGLAARLGAADDPVATVAEFAVDCLCGADERAVVEAELYLAATHRPELRPLAEQWRADLVRVLEHRFPADRCPAAAAFLDGVLIDALTSVRPLTPAVVEQALRALLGVAITPTGSCR
ncbi:TetR/AcrR family transcriptional regulator [Actinokineospora diospyrosa]|uniref:Transcriptional regulator, TetR family n=1 Tax=Actinokineospora diospyrosa TaxID=103728 RepID=A0ABT1IML6_9PSEU|nr:transcriptional regulator, TetR family [Actinokineospora diospyrosa]